jgi:hypothetical protein
MIVSLLLCCGILVVRVNLCINFGRLKMMYLLLNLMWSCFMVYKGPMKWKLGRELGQAVPTLKIVGLKTGCHMTWVETYEC